MRTRSASGLKFDSRGTDTVTDALTCEAPLQIRLNERPFTVTMRTPGDDPCLVRGLLFTEGVIVGDASTPFTIETPAEDDTSTNDVNVSIPDIYLCEKIFERRSLLSSASCGICGIRDLNDVQADGPPLESDVTVEFGQLEVMFGLMGEKQDVFTETGGCHAAAAFSADAELLAVFEDIGRHNAVDKVIGALLADGRLGEADVILVSGRISFEIVLKAYRAAVPILVAVSAPSSMAIDVGEQFGMTIIGFCRDGRATVYSNPRRIVE
jgi:FdhD protein